MSKKTLILVDGADQAQIVADLGLTQRRIGDIMFFGPYSPKELTAIEKNLKDCAAAQSHGFTAYFFPVRVENYPGRPVADDAPLA